MTNLQFILSIPQRNAKHLWTDSFYVQFHIFLLKIFPLSLELLLENFKVYNVVAIFVLFVLN